MVQYSILWGASRFGPLDAASILGAPALCWTEGFVATKCWRRSVRWSSQSIPSVYRPAEDGHQAWDEVTLVRRESDVLQPVTYTRSAGVGAETPANLEVDGDRESWSKSWSESWIQATRAPLMRSRSRVVLHQPDATSCSAAEARRCGGRRRKGAGAELE